MIAYASRDDLPSFQELYRRHAPRVRAYLTRAFRAPEDRDEVFQRTFLKMHRSRSRYDAGSPFVAFLFVIARSERLDFIRERGRKTGHEVQGEEFDRAAATYPSENPASSLAPRLDEELERARAHLSPEQLDVIRWRAIEEAEFEVIAQRLGKSEVSVRKILSRGLARLRALAQTPREEGE